MNAARSNTEAYYEKIAIEKNNALIELSMPDGKRCDLVAETQAIEVDFTDKWECSNTIVLQLCIPSR